MDEESPRQQDVAALRDELLADMDPIEDFAAALNRHVKTVKRWNPPTAESGVTSTCPGSSGASGCGTAASRSSLNAAVAVARRLNEAIP